MIHILKAAHILVFYDAIFRKLIVFSDLDKSLADAAAPGRGEG